MAKVALKVAAGNYIVSKAENILYGEVLNRKLFILLVCCFGFFNTASNGHAEQIHALLYHFIFLKLPASFIQWPYKHKIDKMDSFLSKLAYISPFLKAS